MLLNEIDKQINELINENRLLENKILENKEKLFFLNAYKNNNYQTNNKLTKRELEVCKCINNRIISNIEISNKLFISVNTVKKHISNILHKTKCDNKIELIIKIREIIYER